jgi:hypothetical protein
MYCPLFSVSSLCLVLPSLRVHASSVSVAYARVLCCATLPSTHALAAGRGGGARSSLSVSSKAMRLPRSTRGALSKCTRFRRPNHKSVGLRSRPSSLIRTTPAPLARPEYRSAQQEIADRLGVNCSTVSQPEQAAEGRMPLTAADAGTRCVIAGPAPHTPDSHRAA